MAQVEDAILLTEHLDKDEEAPEAVAQQGFTWALLRQLVHWYPYTLLWWGLLVKGSRRY